MKRMKTLWLSAALGLAIYSAAMAETTMKYAHPNPSDSIGGQFADRFAKLVKEKTGGEVIVNVFPASQLGTAKERFEATQFGLIDFGHDSYSTLSQAVPDFGALDLPYLYRDVEHAVAAATREKSPPLRTLNDKLKAAANIEVLSSYLYGIRELTTSTFPVYSPADLAGKRIRAIPVPVWIAMVEGMNAIPTPVDFSELPTALATGVVDGQENPLTAILTSKMYETQSYLMLTDHMINMIPLYANSASLAKLKEKDQKSVREAATEAAADILILSVKEHERLRSELAAKGMTVIGPEEGLDREAFRTRVSEHVRKKFPEWQGLIDSIQAIE